jgi:hypothetical protein
MGYPFAAQLGIGSSTPVGTRLDFASCGVVLAEQILDFNGLRGTRSRDISRTRVGPRRVHGPISFESPTRTEWTALLPWLFGAAGSSGNYSLGDSLASQAQYVVVDRVEKVFTYNGCMPDTGAIRSSQNGPVSLDLQIIGIDETVGASGSFPALSIDTASAPFIHTDSAGAITIGGTAYPVRTFSTEIRNFVDANRFFNSQILSANANAMDRQIAVSLEMPYKEANAVYGIGNSGVAIIVTYTNGAHSMTLTFANVAFGRDTPPTPSRDNEEMLVVHGVAYASGATKELVVAIA